jgi:hypothetical protein
MCDLKWSEEVPTEPGWYWLGYKGEIIPKEVYRATDLDSGKEGMAITLMTGYQRWVDEYTDATGCKWCRIPQPRSE